MDIPTKGVDPIQVMPKSFFSENHLSKHWPHPVSHVRGSPRVYPVRFGLHAVKLMPLLKSRGQGQPKSETKADGPQIFQNMSWDHKMDWSAAHLTPLLKYLRGNSSLQLPLKWRSVLPQHIWEAKGSPVGSQSGPIKIVQDFELFCYIFDRLYSTNIFFSTKIWKNNDFRNVVFHHIWKAVLTRSYPFGPVFWACGAVPRRKKCNIWGVPVTVPTRTRSNGVQLAFNGVHLVFGTRSRIRNYVAFGGASKGHFQVKFGAPNFDFFGTQSETIGTRFPEMEILRVSVTTVCGNSTCFNKIRWAWTSLHCWMMTKKVLQQSATYVCQTFEAIAKHPRKKHS